MSDLYRSIEVMRSCGIEPYRIVMSKAFYEEVMQEVVPLRDGAQYTTIYGIPFTVEDLRDGLRYIIEE